jgi:uncharacterized protein
MANDNSLMEFPCDFQIKIIGTHSLTFMDEIVAIARKHFPATKDESIRSQPSQQGNFLAITITLYVQDQASLDVLYMELTKHPEIKMVL